MTKQNKEVDYSKYGKLEKLYKKEQRIVFAFENGIIIVELCGSYEDRWLEIEELL